MPRNAVVEFADLHTAEHIIYQVVARVAVSVRFGDADERRVGARGYGVRGGQFIAADGDRKITRKENESAARRIHPRGFLSRSPPVLVEASNRASGRGAQAVDRGDHDSCQAKYQESAL